MYHYITCSPVDPLQWMGAVRMRVQTAAKNITNITVIHTTPVYQLMYCEVKSCTFVRNKSIVKGLVHPKIKFSLCLQEWLLRTTVSRSGKKGLLHLKYGYLSYKNAWIRYRRPSFTSRSRVKHVLLWTRALYFMSSEVLTKSTRLYPLQGLEGPGPFLKTPIGFVSHIHLGWFKGE